jgi:hypothetical protein
MCYDARRERKKTKLLDCGNQRRERFNGCVKHVEILGDFMSVCVARTYRKSLMTIERATCQLALPDMYATLIVSVTKSDIKRGDLTSTTKPEGCGILCPYVADERANKN